MMSIILPVFLIASGLIKAKVVENLLTEVYAELSCLNIKL
jgi:hypothetical protein